MANLGQTGRTWATLVVWALHAVCVTAALGYAALFMLMATSLDPMQVVTAGVEPWANALFWTLAVLGIVLLSAIGLRLWHSRFRPVGLVLLVVEIGGLAFAGWTIYAEYF